MIKVSSKFAGKMTRFKEGGHQKEILPLQVQDLEMIK